MGYQRVTENKDKVTKTWPKKKVSGLPSFAYPLCGTLIKNGRKSDFRGLLQSDPKYNRKSDILTRKVTQKGPLGSQSYFWVYFWDHFGETLKVTFSCHLWVTLKFSGLHRDLKNYQCSTEVTKISTSTGNTEATKNITASTLSFL